MYNLTDPNIIKYLCKKYGFTFSKGMGQNFITDETVPAIMAKTAADGAEGVLEIGPGFGTLTAALGAKAKKVLCCELDDRLKPVLSETLAGFNNISFVWGDFLKLDLKKLLDEEFPALNVSVAANLPYYITTPVIMALIESRLPFKKIVVMVQKEVAERLCAKAGSKDYGAITLTVNYFCRCSILKIVPAASFIPAPKVDSAVVCMEVLDAPSVTPKNEKLFFRVIKAAFSQRRKTLVNALSGAGCFGDKQTVLGAVRRANLAPSIRGEALDINDFCRLADILGE